MNTLSDYFRLKEIDRVEAEKQAMITLKKIIDICLKKSFHFSVNQNTFGITVHVDNYFNKSLDAYFKGDLINYKSEYSMTVQDMLEQLKNSPINSNS